MLLTLQTFLDNVDSYLDKIAIPDWTHLDVKSKETMYIPWDQIYIDHDKNESKVEPHTAEEIECLRLSFAEGVNLNEFPPGVKYRGKQYAKPFELEYGYGRSESLRLLKTKGWVFTLLDGSEDALEDVQAAENEGLPKRLNKEVDMRKFLLKKVRTGKIKNTEEAIRAKFRKVYPNRSKEVMNRVVQQVCESAGIEQPYVLYTSPKKVQDWLDNNSREEYCLDGEFDTARDMYGALMKEGYQYRTVLNAVSKYVQTGKKTYVIYHCGAPTKKSGFLEKRNQVIMGFENIRENLSACGMNVWPIEYMGALPQDREKDNFKSLVI